jgi:hypothetical protein
MLTLNPQILLPDIKGITLVRSGHKRAISRSKVLHYDRQYRRARAYLEGSNVFSYTVGKRKGNMHYVV